MGWDGEGDRNGDRDGMGWDGMGQPWDGMMNGFAHGTIQPEGCRPKEQHLLHPPRAAQPQHCKLAIKLTALAFEYPKC